MKEKEQPKLRPEYINSEYADKKRVELQRIRAIQKRIELGKPEILSQFYLQDVSFLLELLTGD